MNKEQKPRPKATGQVCLRPKRGSSLVGQQAKDLALSLQQLGSLLWHGFDCWPGSFHKSRVWPKTNKQTNKQTKTNKTQNQTKRKEPNIKSAKYAIPPTNPE